MLAAWNFITLRRRENLMASQQNLTAVQASEPSAWLYHTSKAMQRWFLMGLVWSKLRLWLLPWGILPQREESLIATLLIKSRGKPERELHKCWRTLVPGGGRGKILKNKGSPEPTHSVKRQLQKCANVFWWFCKKLSMLRPKAGAWLVVTEFSGIFLKRDNWNQNVFCP